MSNERYRANVMPRVGDRTPNAERVVEITRDDLPLHCPMDGSSLWDSHPRVYLPIERSGEAVCPYCGTRFHLKDR